MSPVDAVLGTYELLEAILLHLSEVRELFIVQRVSRSWQAVSLRSQATQKRMFLAPTERPLRPVFKDTRYWISEYEQELRITPIVGIKHIERRRSCKHTHYTESDRYALQKAGVMQTRPERAVEFESTRKHDAKQYSLMKMFVTQPAVRTVGIMVGSVKRDGDWKVPICTIRNPAGVTVMDVCHAVRSVLLSHYDNTGEQIRPSQFGFVFVDPAVSDSRRAKLEGRWEGLRYGVCEECERETQEGSAKSFKKMHLTSQGLSKFRSVRFIHSRFAVKSLLPWLRSLCEHKDV